MEPACAHIRKTDGLILSLLRPPNLCAHRNRRKGIAWIALPIFHFRIWRPRRPRNTSRTMKRFGLWTLSFRWACSRVRCRHRPDHPKTVIAI